MANTYSWVINSMEVIPSVDGLSDVVTIVNWSYVGINPTNIRGTVSSASNMPLPTSENFTPYGNLTQDIVISWLESKLNVSDLQTRVDTQINLIVNPPTVELPLPWNT
jgi:hypothetical protein